MTLLQQVEQFLYTHPVQHHKKQLLMMVHEAEEKYLRRIAELEQDIAIAALNRITDQREKKVNNSDGNLACECHKLPEGTACSWCMSQPVYLHQDEDEERW